jgi:predicted flap endonuclease-1-like 5' DNA nuclease
MSREELASAAIGDAATISALDTVSPETQIHMRQVSKHEPEGHAMANTPDIRPVGDLPNEIGKTAARELAYNGITTLQQIAEHSKKELLAIHGVGPKAIAILGDALAAKGLDYKES